MADQEEPLVNKVEKKREKANIEELDLGQFHQKGERVIYDIKDDLWQGIALKEKEFRQKVKEHNWHQYQGKFVAIHCSEDAIIPTWAYMLLAGSLTSYAKKVIWGDQETLEAELFRESLRQNLNPEEYREARVMIKGCGDVYVPPSAFIDATTLLAPFAKTISYGEACSAVKVFRSRGRSS